MESLTGCSLGEDQLMSLLIVTLDVYAIRSNLYTWPGRSVFFLPDGQTRTMS